MWIAGTMAWAKSLGHVIDVLSDLMAFGHAFDDSCMSGKENGWF